MSKIKTNAMRILDTHNIEYNIITYDKKDGKVDGVSVAKKIGKDPEKVFKTLVAQGSSGFKESSKSYWREKDRNVTS